MTKFILFSVGIFMAVAIDRPADTKESMLQKVNAIRAQGCYCGKRWMEPTTPLSWNATLEKSALSHAKDMDQYKFFSHFSYDGKDIGQRIEAYGYNWQYVGENIGEGQLTFDEVLKDWLNSRTHCRMLMNPTMKEMGVVKFKNYWVQHFATKMQ